MADETRQWSPRPDRRWGWVSNDGYEVEWRHAEGGEPAGYHLFGEGVFGRRIDRSLKSSVLAEADFIIAMLPVTGGDAR